MGRQRRPHLPGAIFHLTARTLRREHLFTPELRTAALAEIAAAVPRSWSRLLAVAIMSNHLHLVVQQGQRPLSALMQPLLRRMALRVQRAHGLEGPVFWRHYASRPCLGPDHARNAIVYTHLNPVRAGLCRAAADWAWSSHHVYSETAAYRRSAELARVRRVLDPTLALPLFARSPGRSDAGLRVDYDAFVDGRLASDLSRAEGEDPVSSDHCTPPGWPDPVWGPGIRPLFGSESEGFESSAAGRTVSRRDMADVARDALTRGAEGVTLEQLRGRGGGRDMSHLRRVVIRRLHAAGFRNIEIARCLDISETTVSRAVRHGP